VAAYVINEWLWHDLAGDNGREHQLQAIRLITQFGASEHQIVVIEGSRFDQKAWSLCKSADQAVRQGVVAFVLNIRLNSDKCLILKSSEISPFPEDLVSTIKPDDRYLVQAQLAVDGSAIVTNDNPLQQALNHAGLRCMSRGEFLALFPNRD